MGTEDAGKENAAQKGGKKVDRASPVHVTSFSGVISDQPGLQITDF